MTNAEIVSYVMHSPDNTSPAVLTSMLEQLSSGGSVGTLTIDKTYDELLTAYNANKIIRIPSPDQSCSPIIMEAYIDSDIIFMFKGMVGADGGDRFVGGMQITSSGSSGEYNRYTY